MRSAVLILKRHTHLCILFGLLFIFSQSLYSQVNCDARTLFTAKACNGDAVSDEERALYSEIVKYRHASNVETPALSNALSILANRRLLDLKLNMRTLTHSWSNCRYDPNELGTLPCLNEAPRRFGLDYKGNAYEVLYFTSNAKVTAGAAVEAWSRSRLHSLILLNRDEFEPYSWDAVGVAVSGGFASVWFGGQTRNSLSFAKSEDGLGLSLKALTEGFDKVVPVAIVSSTVAEAKWEGVSKDKSIRLTIFGTEKEVAEANVRLTIAVSGSGRPSPKSLATVKLLLRNVFPKWEERDSWLEAAVASISNDRSTVFGKVVEGADVEASYVGGSFALTISPSTRVRSRQL
ncbi:MAG: hypothetical protein KF736_06575 [Acidobacteria bacterium]|nr:hypothetical protein [Acidobacteriota bacterium]MCW5949134.1 hypothetical protein [Pyrinomonadaceae bacterium]